MSDFGDRHSHSHAPDSESRLGLAALLTGGFMLVEIAGGLVAGSLALLADAAHMLTDFAALGLAWCAFRISRRPADWKRTFGFDRLQILIAFVNGLALFVIAGWIVYEAVERILRPPEVNGGILLGVAVLGLAINALSYWLLHGAGDNLNARAAALHVMGDLLGSVAAIVAGVVILAAGWTPVDPILSVLVALIILKSAWQVVVESGHVLLEGAPHAVDSRKIAPDLVANVAGVEEVHHVHVWSITQERRMVTLHACLGAADNPESVIRQIKQRLKVQFDLDHATIEIERDLCADAQPEHEHAHG